MIEFAKAFLLFPPPLLVEMRKNPPMRTRSEGEIKKIRMQPEWKARIEEILERLSLVVRLALLHAFIEWISMRKRRCTDELLGARSTGLHMVE
jgi:hypothetical protein